jgi:hypothetical protein
MPDCETHDYNYENIFYELANVRTLVTFRDLDPYNYDLFYSISGEVTEAIRTIGRSVDVDKCWPDVYLVIYNTGTEVV